MPQKGLRFEELFAMIPVLSGKVEFCAEAYPLLTNSRTLPMTVMKVPRMTDFLSLSPRNMAERGISRTGEVVIRAEATPTLAWATA